jgi:hypothetical protein
MGTIAIAILAVVGFASLVALCAAGLAALHDDWRGQPPAADPYRDGLDASARISAMAFETERLMHAAAENARSEED